MGFVASSRAVLRGGKREKAICYRRQQRYRGGKVGLMCARMVEDQNSNIAAVEACVRGGCTPEGVEDIKARLTVLRGKLEKKISSIDTVLEDMAHLGLLEEME